jgi:CPA1 family monovalent cation:H+ antiporter
MRVIYYNQEISNLVALGYVLLLTVSLIAIRFIWIYICWKPAHILGSSAKKSIPKPKSFLLISISGVRGAVTLAAAFSIPFTLQNGSSFPERDLIIFLAAGVILTSMVIASIFLPILTSRNVTAEATGIINPEQAARIKLMKAVIKAMKEESNTENREAALAVIADSHRAIRQITNKEDGGKPDFRVESSETQIWLTALNAEGREVENMLEQGLITSEISNRLLETVNHREMLLTTKYKYRFLIFIHLLKRLVTAFKLKKKRASRICRKDIDFMFDIRTRMSKAAVNAVKEQMNDKNTDMSLSVITHYNEAIERFGSGLREVRTGKRSVNNKKELQFKSIQIQRNEVQNMFEKGEISRETANKLRRFINYTEASMLQEDELTEM